MASDRLTPFVSELPDVFLTCRSVGHAWEPSVTYAERAGRHDIHRAVWYCSREAQAGIDDPTRKEVLSYAKGKSAGKLVDAPRLVYPPGYLVAEHLGRGHSRPVSRLELMERLVTSPKARNGLKAVK